LRLLRMRAGTTGRRLQRGWLSLTNCLAPCRRVLPSPLPSPTSSPTPTSDADRGGGDAGVGSEGGSPSPSPSLSPNPSPSLTLTPDAGREDEGGGGGCTGSGGGSPSPDPGNPQNRPEVGAPGPPDILGLSKEIVGFRNRGGGPAGHPQGVQVKTLIPNIKCLPEGRHVL
jgi:hypothetical protein